MTDKLIKDNNLTAIMVTHNMKDAIKHGNRLIMMMNGKNIGVVMTLMFINLWVVFKSLLQT